jgi:hypothetical protein
MAHAAGTLVVCRNNFPVIDSFAHLTIREVFFIQPSQQTFQRHPSKYLGIFKLGKNDAESEFEHICRRAKGEVPRKTRKPKLRDDAF